MDATKKEQAREKFFYFMICLIIFFTTSDLVCGFAGQPIPAAICSIISAIFVFVGYFAIKKANTEKSIESLTKFVKSNFDKWQIILSLLDVICSMVSVFTSIIALGMFFRSIIFTKILFTPAKIVTISNKFKTVTQPLLIFCFVWVFIRMKNKLKERKMSNIKLSLTQKIFIIVAFVLGVAYTLVSTIWFPQLAIFDDTLAQLATSLGGTAGVIFGAFLKGKEMTSDEIAKRNEKVQHKIEVKNEKVAKKAELEHQKLKAEKMAKAQALVDQRKKEAEEKAKADAEKAEIEALAKQIEEKEKAQEVVVENTIQQ